MLEKKTIDAEDFVFETEVFAFEWSSLPQIVAMHPPTILPHLHLLHYSWSILVNAEFFLAWCALDVLSSARALQQHHGPTPATPPLPRLERRWGQGTEARGGPRCPSSRPPERDAGRKKKADVARRAGGHTSRRGQPPRLPERVGDCLPLREARDAQIVL